MDQGVGASLLNQIMSRFCIAQIDEILSYAERVKLWILGFINRRINVIKVGLGTQIMDEMPANEAASASD
jgi:hypothetical protein